MAVELEIKLTLHPQQVPQAVAWLLEQPGASKGVHKRLVNTYYDTPSNELNGQRIALRLRQAGGRTIQTLKTQGEFVNGAHKRNEWEWQVPGPHLQLGLLADTPLADNVNLARLAPVFETNFERQVIMLTDGSAVIEVAVDTGEIIANEQSRALCEIEFELKSGNPDSLLIWAQKLAQQCPVFLNLVSKAEQGYFLADMAKAGVRAVGGAGEKAGEIADVAEEAEHSGEPGVPLNSLLQRLSQSWLKQQAVDMNGLNLDALAQLAARCGVSQPWAALVAQLQGGTRVSSLLQQPLLGQMQLAMLSHMAGEQGVH
ncbi:MAG: CYTH domain-containing protein [Marinobacter sp.]